MCVPRKRHRDREVLYGRQMHYAGLREHFPGVAYLRHRCPPTS
jgi:hypothetical protein